jgi:tartrate/fumarate subfamily iron-sulfur-dependent hydro-lyase alpha chain
VKTLAEDFYARLAAVAGSLYARSLLDVPRDVRQALERARQGEQNPLACSVLDLILRNVQLADEHRLLVCQDTGLPIYWVRVGPELAVDGRRLTEAIRRGVEEATAAFSLRSSVCHPLTRENPQTNTGRLVPVVHLEFGESGDFLEITVLPKGSGSENQTFFRMLNPADGLEGVKRFVLESLVQAGPKGCPPYVIGVGLGGSADLCMVLAKKALLRPVGRPHPDPSLAELERELLQKANALGIGPQGLGGRTTALAVHIEYAYTHISQNPVAVNMQCWRGLRASARLYADGREEVLD